MEEKSRAPNRTSLCEEAEGALFRRAVGMTVSETRTELTDKGEKAVTTEKELPPDITALQFWLRNRCPERWGDKAPETEVPENNLLEILQQAAEDL